MPKSNDHKYPHSNVIALPGPFPRHRCGEARTTTARTGSARPSAAGGGNIGGGTCHKPYIMRTAGLPTIRWGTKGEPHMRDFAPGWGRDRHLCVIFDRRGGDTLAHGYGCSWLDARMAAIRSFARSSMDGAAAVDLIWVTNVCAALRDCAFPPGARCKAADATRRPLGVQGR